MATVRMNEHARVASPSFDDFVGSRPDEETWELVDGSFMMQAQPSVEHQIIAGNVERLLNDALERAGIPRFAVQAAAIDLGNEAGDRYVPDVAVLDPSEEDLGRNASETCFLACEVVSPSDLRIVPSTGETKIATKVKGYRRLQSCEAIMVVGQNTPVVTVHVRTDGAWRSEELTSLEDDVVLPTFGLRCSLADIYARTRALAPVTAPGP